MWSYATNTVSRLAVAGALAASLWVVAPYARQERASELVFAGAGPTSERQLTGRAAVIDGDTLDIDGERVRLEGIDAPEMAQTCPRPWVGRLGVPGLSTWAAGRSAARALERFVGGQQVTCLSLGRDTYGRVLGRCTAGGVDINREMVRRGHAWAFVKYSNAFVAEERAARTERAGIWQSDCQTAWDYRAGHWQANAQTAPEGCAIKGNVSRAGRLYHMPWSPFYAKTRVEPERGERWFCSESEALAAGWKPALVR